ncbi:MAG: hypothetical protein ACR2MS_01425 [Weeksellaceae bacterium]
MTGKEFKIYAEDAIMDITHRIDELRQRSNTIDADIKNDFEDKIAGLIQNRDDLRALVEDYEYATENQWEEFKVEFSTGLERLQKGFEKLFNILSN